MNTLRDIIGAFIAIGGIFIFAALAFGAWLLEPGCDVRRKGEYVRLTPLPNDSRRYYRYAVICGIIAVLAALALCSARAGEVSLCYDEVRWAESSRVAKRGGIIVLNINDGRGLNTAEIKQWDAFGARLRSVGGKSIGYVDFLDNKGLRKPNAKVVVESINWISAGHHGVWLDDARDNGADADVVREIKRLRPKAMVCANPGTRCSGPLKRSGAILCESESNGPVYWGTIVIAFVKDAKTADAVRLEAKRRGTWLALESASTYHVAGVEYQRKNPYILP